MSADVIIFSLMASTAVTSVGWYLSAQARKRAEDRLWGVAAAQGLPVTTLSRNQPIPAATSPRIDQLESHIDQMSQQIDRLAESQEFLSRVLTDRIDQLPDPRLRTPH